MNSLLTRSRLMLISSFAAVYLVWGSTYLAIRFAIETLPTWGMAAARFLVAGAIMIAFSKLRREAKLTKHEIKISFITGALLMSANAIVCFVEHWIPSGIVAVAIAAMPIWVLIIGRFFFGQAKSPLQKWLGALVGLGGVALIAFEQSESSSNITGIGKYAIFILFISSWMWGFGTHFQRKIVKTESPFRYAGAQMLFGGLIISLVSIGFGEPWNFKVSQVSASSFEAWIYLVIFGSVIAFSAFSWLGRNVQPHVLSTYALVNPVIAVVLGGLLAHEAITPKFFSATALVCLGLVMLLFQRKLKSPFSDEFNHQLLARFQFLKRIEQQRIDKKNKKVS